MVNSTIQRTRVPKTSRYTARHVRRTGRPVGVVGLAVLNEGSWSGFINGDQIRTVWHYLPNETRLANNR